VVTGAWIVLPVEALQSFDEVAVDEELPVLVPVLAEVAAAVDFADFMAVPFEETVVAPVAMQAPRTAVAATLATPVSTRDRAAGLRRRGRGLVGFVMATIIRIPGKRPSKRT
jgi:hypothetical protein